MPGVQGERGPAGPQGHQGPKGIQGESAEVGVTYIRWGKKTCPNTGATLVYEGNNKIICFLSNKHFYRSHAVEYNPFQIPFCSREEQFM